MTPGPETNDGLFLVAKAVARVPLSLYWFLSYNCKATGWGPDDTCTQSALHCRRGTLSLRNPKSFLILGSIPALWSGRRDYSYIEIPEIILWNKGQWLTRYTEETQEEWFPSHLVISFYHLSPGSQLFSNWFVFAFYIMMEILILLSFCHQYLSIFCFVGVHF